MFDQDLSSIFDGTQSFMYFDDERSLRQRRQDRPRQEIELTPLNIEEKDCGAWPIPRLSRDGFEEIGTSLSQYGHPGSDTISFSIDCYDITALC